MQRFNLQAHELNVSEVHRPVTRIGDSREQARSVRIVTSNGESRQEGVANVDAMKANLSQCELSEAAAASRLASI